MLRLCTSPSEVLVGFGVDCCACLYDGRAVWALPRCARALRRGANVLNPLHAWPNAPTYELRLAKYAARGFTVVVPGLDRARVDWPRVRGGLSKLAGLARLLAIELVVDDAARPSRTTAPAIIRANATAAAHAFGSEVFKASIYDEGEGLSYPITALSGDEANALHRHMLAPESVFILQGNDTERSCGSAGDDEPRGVSD